MPPSKPDPPLDETRPHGFPLTQADIDEFKAIVEREFGVRMGDQEAPGTGPPNC